MMLAANRQRRFCWAALVATALVLSPLPPIALWSATAAAQDDDTKKPTVKRQRADRPPRRKADRNERKRRPLPAKRAARPAAQPKKPKAVDTEAPPKPPAPTKPADAPAKEAAKNKAPARPTAAPKQAADAEEDAPDIKPFETGIDYKPTSPRTRVTFNLEDADLPDLVRLISQITGKRFILPGKSRSIKATVYAPTKVTAAEAYQAFLSILELNGMALVPAGRYLKIVESGRVEGRAIPLFTDDATVPRGDRFLTRLHRVDHISAEDAASLLERFKSGDGSITAYAPTNMLIVTDTGTNIRRMLRILGVIDIERTGEQIWVEPVHYADASELAARLSEIFEPVQAAGGKKKAAPKPAPKPKAKKGKAPAKPAAPGTKTVGAGAGESRLTKIIADERTNSLIILATESAYLRIIEMLKYLDVSMEGEGRIHVHHLQHSDAEEIASTLQALISGKGGGGSAAKGKGKAAVASTGSIFKGNVAVTAHKASNALVITSSAHDYAGLRSVISKLDTERKQVFIEAVIMELSVDRSSSFGTSFHGGIPDLPTDDSVSVLGFQAGNTIGGLQGLAANGEVLTGLAVGVQGPVIDNSQQLVGLSLPGFGVAINAMASSGDANILSTPHLIATDNVEAEISVGQNVPLQTSGRVGNLGNLGALAGLAGQQGGNTAGLAGLAGLAGGFGGSVPRQDVGTTVTITPHINETGEIRLEINEEISSAGAPSEAGDLGVVSIDRTHAKTEVVVRDQQTVVIGGLMRDQVTNAASKVPILGDIPLIGALFRSTSKRKVKKNLLLFLTPYVVRSPADLRSIYERKMRERQEFLDRYFVFGERDYEPPLDYSRTRGLVGEIMKELAVLDEERQILADAAAQPEPVHTPREPVGSAPPLSSGGDAGGDITIEPTEAAPAPEAPAPEAPAPE